MNPHPQTYQLMKAHQDDLQREAHHHQQRKRVEIEWTEDSDRNGAYHNPLRPKPLFD